MPTVVWLSWSAVSTTRHICVPDERSLCSFFSMLLHGFPSLAANHCCLESTMTGEGISPESLIIAPIGVEGSAHRTDVACRLSRSRRLSRLPTSLEFHQSLLLYSVTAWTQATWTALTRLGILPYVFVRAWSLAAAGLAFIMHQLLSSLIVRCACWRTTGQHVAGLLSLTNLPPTFIFADNSGRRSFLWRHLRVYSAAFVLAV
jgi:hypothetical protein